jgi:hypothetical protein
MKLSCERSSSVSSFVNPFNEGVLAGEETVYLISDLGDEKCSMTETNPQVLPFSNKSQSLDLKDLFLWLESIKLEEYYEVLVEAGYDNSLAMTQQMKGPMPIQDSDLSAIGIRKPGHRRRILWKLEEDLPEKHGRKKSFGLFRCCGHIKDGTGAITSVPELSQVLADVGLSSYLEMFQRTGYESYEIIIAQSSSKFAITKEVMTSEIGIKDLRSVRKFLARVTSDAVTFKQPEILYEEGKIGACEFCVVL